MEQAKKRDHKVVITDIAIEKVPLVKVPGLTDDLCAAIRDEHREILRIAKHLNDSNEVLSVWLPRENRIVRVLGSEHEVTAGTSPEAYGVFMASGRHELFYLHNHPSTNKFSLADLFEFVNYDQIGLISVVTNQGEVYILCKNGRYDYDESMRLVIQAYSALKTGRVSDREAVSLFLKNCGKGGISYVR